MAPTPQLADEDRRRIASACRTEVRALSDLVEVLGRTNAGSLRNKVQGMVAAGLLSEEPPPRARTRRGYLLTATARPLLDAAERTAAAEAKTKRERDHRVLEPGQRLLLIDGEDVSGVATVLRELAVERDARWIARLDGRGNRLLVALNDDGPRADEVEAALQRVRGTLTQGKVDRFFDRDGLSAWIDRVTKEKT